MFFRVCVTSVLAAAAAAAAAEEEEEEREEQEVMPARKARFAWRRAGPALYGPAGSRRAGITCAAGLITGYRQGGRTCRDAVLAAREA